MSRSFLSARNDFLQFFPNCTGSPLYITPQILKGASDGTKVHSALWKFYLVIAPNCQKQFARDQDWIRILKEKRAEYFELKTKHFIKPPDDDQNDPLLASQNSEWNQFFKDQDLRQQIKTDTNRAFQELDFFHMPENLQTLEDILFLFCRTHPNYGYPQGLHELAAFILYTFHEEMIADKDDTISFIFNANSVVPDTYFTFEKLAEYLEPFYSDVQDLSEEVQNVIIARKSPQLAKSLQMSGIAPHTYMMKWMRLLFLSVFDFDSVRPMWDVIIAHLPNLKVIKNACAAMLLNAGKKLINGDSTEALQLLFHYPAVPQPARFVVEGVEMTNKDGKGKMSREDLIMVVAERLNELSRGLNDICTLNGYELALPYVMDLRRTRDILIGILPVEEMLPLEMAVELFTPQKVEYTPVNEGNTGMNANSLHDKNEKTDFEFIKASSKSSSSKDNNNSSSTTTTTVNQNVLFGGDEETVNDKANALFSDEPKPQSAADQKLFSGSKGVKSKQKRDGLASIVKQGSTQELFGDLEKPKSLSQADKTLFEIVQQPPSTNSQSVKVLEKASDPDFLNKQTVIQKVTPKRAESSSMSAGSQEKVLDDPLMSFKKEETNEKRSLFDTNSNQNEQKEKNKSQLLQNTDLFGNPTNSNSSSTNSKGGSLFDDESKKLENDPLFTAKASKKPKSGGTDDLLFGKKSQSKDAGSLFADDGKEANKKPRNNSKKSMPKASPFESNTTLDDNDPLFGGSTSTSSNGNNSTAGKKAKVIINKQALKKNTNLDKEKEEEILPKPKQKSIKPSIYDDDDEIQNAIIKKPNTTEKKGGLLDDDDDDFLSGVSKPKQADKPKPKGGLFD